MALTIASALSAGLPPVVRADGMTFATAPLPGPAVQEPVLSMLVPKFDNSYPSSSEEIPGLERLKGYSKIINVRLLTALDSSKNQSDDKVTGVLTEDLRIGGILVAKKNAVVNGRVISTEGARTLVNALRDSSRRYKSRGCVVVQFDEIVDERGNHVSIHGTPAHQVNYADGREIKVDRLGRIIKCEDAFSPEKRKMYNAGRLVQVIPIPGTILANIIIPPMIMGAAGAADPSFAYNKPVDASAPDARKKGAIYGFVTNLPGAWAVQACVEKGNEIDIRSGQEMAINIQVGTFMHGPANAIVAKFHPPEGAFGRDNKYRTLIVPSNGGNRLVPSSALADEVPDAGAKQVKGIVVHRSPAN